MDKLDRAVTFLFKQIWGVYFTPHLLGGVPHPPKFLVECANCAQGSILCLTCLGFEGQMETHILCLFPEILAMIFSYLDVRDKGRAAQVCAAWRDASYHKSVWRGVEAKLHLRRSNPSLFPSLQARGIRRLQVGYTLPFRDTAIPP